MPTIYGFYVIVIFWKRNILKIPLDAAPVWCLTNCCQACRKHWKKKSTKRDLETFFWTVPETIRDRNARTHTKMEHQDWIWCLIYEVPTGYCALKFSSISLLIAERFLRQLTSAHWDFTMVTSWGLSSFSRFFAF